MSILNQQLIGGGFPENLAINPFPHPPEWETPSLGFGGYTYAATPELQGIFNTTPPDERTGPRDTEESKLTAGMGTQYGAHGRRLGPEAKTILGEMAEMINPSEDGTEPVWNDTGGGKKMGHTFMSSGSLRSLNDATETVGQGPNASGGAVAGYDANNNYGISNWLAEGGAGNAAVEAEDAMPGEGNLGVEASNKEVFSPTVTVQTGLRKLPASPDVGSAGTGSVAGSVEDL